MVLAPFLLVLRSGHVGRLAGALAVACALVGAAWSVHGIATRAADPLRARIGHVEQARLVIEGQPRPGPFGSSAIARLDGHPIELRTAGTLQQGAIVEVSGRLAPVPPSPEGFDRRTWLARQGVHETLAARSLAVLGRRGGIQGVLDRLRHGARAALQAGGDDESSRIATGVALGGTATLDDSTVEAFRASGLAHLLAVSGGNVVLLVAAVLGLAWLARVPRPLAHGCAIPAVIAYAAIVGGGPSVVRAAATGALASLAWLVGSARDPWHLLALAAAAVLALDPWAIAGPGFQLSFVAVAAIHGLAPPIRRWLEGTVVPLRLCSPLAISVACTLATAPVALVHFGRTSLVASLPANLLALPAVAPLLWFALASCARLAGRARGGGAARRCGARARRLHRPGRAAWRLARRRSARAPAARSCSPAAALAWLACRRPAAAFAGALAGLLVALTWPAARGSPPPARALRVTFLDVGQGDATLIEAPGTRALVDTGPPEARVEAQLRKRGVHSLDALFLSHDESDHDGRAAEILRALKVAVLVTPALPGHSASLEAAISAARARGTRVLRGRAGLVLRRGAVELRVLGPLHATPRDAEERRRARDPGAPGNVLVPAAGRRRIARAADGRPAARRSAGGRAPWLRRPASRATARAAAAAARGHLRRRAQHLRPSRREHADGARRGRCAGPPHRSRGLHRARLRRGRVTQIRSRRCPRPRSIPST